MKLFYGWLRYGNLERSFYVDFSDDMKSACFCPLCQMHSPMRIERAHIPYSARWVEKGPQGHHVIYERYLRTVHLKKNHLIQVRLLTMKRRNIAKGTMDPTKIKLHNLSQTSAAKY